MLPLAHVNMRLEFHRRANHVDESNTYQGDVIKGESYWLCSLVLMSWPASEVTIDDRLVRDLLHEQFPQFDDDECVPVAEGFDNSLWRIGEQHVARFPRRKMAVTTVENELRWLPEMAGHVSLPTPLPLMSGAPSERFAWPWSICSWINGVPGDEIAFDHEGRSARTMATFLRELHTTAPRDAPHNPYRSVALAANSPTFDDRLSIVSNRVDADATRRLFALGVAAPAWRHRAVWLHGDFHPGNIVYQGPNLVGVVDFGDLCTGDPATDLAGGLLSLPLCALDEFFHNYGVADDSMIQRTIGWAAHFGVLMTALGLVSRPSYLAPGLRALENATALANS